MLRFLHTSDWHLGTTLGGFVSRDEDHRRMLQWLTATVREQAIDVLIVAGDIFDQAQPSAEAQRLYYGFLHGLARTGVRSVVIVGGNHDSPTRLDAPREVLGVLGIHVVGALPDPLAAALVPIARDPRRPQAIVAAVPFVSEFRLGVRTSLVDNAGIARQFVQRMGAMYSSLADEAERIGRGAPIIATGHIACAGSDPNDAPVEIHRHRRDGGIPESVFDPRIAYVALGHIHRMRQVGASRAWYSGSPLALTLAEAATERNVLRVDIGDDGIAAVRPIAVPAFRAIESVSGTFEQVAAKLRELPVRGELPTLVYVRIDTDARLPSARGDLDRIVRDRGEGAPVIVDVRENVPTHAPDITRPAKIGLRNCDPEEVFRRLCATRGEDLDDALLAAFREVAAARDDDDQDETDAGAA